MRIARPRTQALLPLTYPPFGAACGWQSMIVKVMQNIAFCARRDGFCS